ncbi:hypothetical protein WJT86_05320 [Microvirga sp. W0021]|uniref:Uncharacterized protein n=1 Tax=Hohaiivirga grylli TaxID=3133970 RepID=A0ABV0BHM6_9HYPH
MRPVLFFAGFLSFLVIAAGSFASIIEQDNTPEIQTSEQTFFIPRNHGSGITECLSEHNECGQAAATSICSSKGFNKLVSFGEASAEDMTASITKLQKGSLVQGMKDIPFLVTCAR